MYAIDTPWGNDCGRAQGVPAPLTECSLHPQRKIKKTKSTDESVEPILQ